MKELAFPDAKAFGDIFPEAANKHDLTVPSPSLGSWSAWSGEGKSELSSFCSVRRSDGYQSLTVEPSREVRKFITDEMLKIAGDSIHFEAVFRDDGTVLLVAKYGVIIGSRWLALVDAATFPAMPPEED